jgi:hypothetical protein
MIESVVGSVLWVVVGSIPGVVTVCIQWTVSTGRYSNDYHCKCSRDSTQ